MSINKRSYLRENENKVKKLLNEDFSEYMTEDETTDSIEDMENDLEPTDSDESVESDLTPTQSEQVESWVDELLASTIDIETGDELESLDIESDGDEVEPEKSINANVPLSAEDMESIIDSEDSLEVLQNELENLAINSEQEELDEAIEMLENELLDEAIETLEDSLLDEAIADLEDSLLDGQISRLKAQLKELENVNSEEAYQLANTIRENIASLEAQKLHSEDSKEATPASKETTYGSDMTDKELKEGDKKDNSLNTKGFLSSFKTIGLEAYEVVGSIFDSIYGSKVPKGTIAVWGGDVSKHEYYDTKDNRVPKSEVVRGLELEGVKDKYDIVLKGYNPGSEKGWKVKAYYYFLVPKKNEIEEANDILGVGDFLKKSKKPMPIDTISNGYKKVGENKWKKVSQVGHTKEEHQQRANLTNASRNYKEENQLMADELDDKVYDDAHVLGEAAGKKEFSKQERELEKIKFENYKLSRVNGLLIVAGDRLTEKSRIALSEGFNKCSNRKEVEAIYAQVVERLKKSEVKSKKLNEAVGKKINVITESKKQEQKPLSLEQQRINYLMGIKNAKNMYGYF